MDVVAQTADAHPLARARNKIEIAMDKFADIFRATVVVFHGIIATWLFLEFTETKVSEFYFLILLVFFSIANMLVWGAALRVAKSVRRRSLVSAGPRSNEVLYRPIDVFGLTMIAFIIGLSAAFLQNKDIVLRLANSLTDWHRTATITPFQLLLAHISAHSMQELDAREPDEVKLAAGKAYLRVFIKDSKFVYEGYPGWVPGKLDKSEIIFTPACRLLLDPSDSTKVAAVQRIEGPGVYLDVSQAVAVEIIDAHQSSCAKKK